MALYIHNPEDDIPFFSPLKMFQEVEENDVVYVVDLTSLKIKEDIISKIEKERKTEVVVGKYIAPQIVSDNEEYEYISVKFKLRNGLNNITVHFGTETSYLDDFNNYLICTTEREANKVVKILQAKCRIQKHQFNSIFNSSL